MLAKKYKCTKLKTAQQITLSFLYVTLKWCIKYNYPKYKFKCL